VETKSVRESKGGKKELSAGDSHDQDPIFTRAAFYNGRCHHRSRVEAGSHSRGLEELREDRAGLNTEHGSQDGMKRQEGSR
jgi:hypothetical protein